MLVEHVDPEFGAVRRAGHRPEVLGDAGRGALVGHLGGGQPQRGDLLRPARPLDVGARRTARGWRRMRVTICDVGAAGRPAEPAGHARARRAGGAGRPARRDRRAADRGGELRQPQARAADGGRRGGRRGDRPARRRRLRRPRPERARLRPAPRQRARRGALRLRRHRGVQPPQRGRHRRGGGRPPRSGSSSARTPTGSARPSRSAPRSAARSRARSTPATWPRSPAESPAPARTRSSSRTRSASACRARCATSSRRIVPFGVPARDPPAQHAQHRLRERVRRARGGRHGLRRLRRRDRRLPVRASGDGEHRDRGPRLPPPRRGRRDGHRPRGADRASRSGSKRSSGASSRGRSTRPGRSLRWPARDERTETMAYRLGVDVGGTFTDLFLVSEGNGGAQFRVKTPSTPARSVRGRPHGRPPDLRRGRHRRRRAAEHPPRHHRRDERRARVEGRARRPDHDAGASGRSSTSRARRRRARSPAGSS